MVSRPTYYTLSGHSISAIQGRKVKSTKVATILGKIALIAFVVFAGGGFLLFSH